MPYLQAQDITKSFNGVGAAVDRASLTVTKGEVLALLGPSGCGKTTLLRILAGLSAPDRGRVELDGAVLVGPGEFVPPQRRSIGMVFQDWALFPHLTVAKNVSFGLRRSEAPKDRAAEILDLVGLPHLAGRYPEELSGGQAQRVALARALAPRPRVLLFDEPFSNLDAGLRVQLRTDVAALMHEVGMTSIFVTHDQEEAFVIGDRVAVMNEGRIVQTGKPGEVYQHPASTWVASFVGESNVLDGAASGGHAATAVGKVPLTRPVEGRCQVVIRPEHLLLAPGGPGVVASVEFYGHDTSYQLEIDGAKLAARAIAAPLFSPGDRVSVSYQGPKAAAFAAAAPRLPG